MEEILEVKNDTKLEPAKEKKPDSIALKPRTITGKPVVKVGKPIVDTPKRGVPKNMEFEKQRDNKLVTGVFHNLENPGKSITFDFLKYKGDVLTEYTFKDGEKRTIPLGVAKHINSCGYPDYEPLSAEMIKGATEQVPMRIVRKKPRFRFQNLDFLDLEEIAALDGDPKILEVESF